MKIKWGWAAAAVVAVGLAGATHDAVADQSNGGNNAKRTVADCSGLPGAEPPKDPAHPSPDNLLHWCITCVNRGGHHFHPTCAAGFRCNDDKGQGSCNKE